MFALLLSMVASLLLGMGLPTSAAYMVLAVLVAPVLLNLGVSKMAAHLFLLISARFLQLHLLSHCRYLLPPGYQVRGYGKLAGMH